MQDQTTPETNPAPDIPAPDIPGPDIPGPDIPRLRRLMADALEEGKPVLIFPPQAACFIEDEMGLDSSEVARAGFMELGLEGEGDPMVGVLIVHIGAGEHLASDLITGSLTVAHPGTGRDLS